MSALPPKADIAQSTTRYWGSEIRFMIGILRVFDLGESHERPGIVMFDIRVDTRRHLPWCIAAPCVARTSSQ